MISHDILEENADLKIEESFCVNDDASANWVVRKIVEAREYAKRRGAWCEREQAARKHDEEFFLFRFRQQLMDYARLKIAEQCGRRKSVNLPAGSLGFRKAPSRIIVDDEAAVIAWAKINKPDLVSIVERLSKSDLNVLVETTGEIPDAGIHIESERETFFVK